jgi:hypothetical protein
MKLELLTNATLVDDAIRFVSQKSKEKLKSSDSGNEMTRKNQMRMLTARGKARRGNWQYHISFILIFLNET